MYVHLHLMYEDHQSPSHCCGAHTVLAVQQTLVRMEMMLACRQMLVEVQWEVGGG